MKNKLYLTVSLHLIFFHGLLGADLAESERIMLDDAMNLAKSDNPLERVMAAENIISMPSVNTPAWLIKLLINDADIRVRTMGYKALSEVCFVGSFTVDEVKGILLIFENDITRNKFDLAFQEKPSSENLILLASKVKAMNAIYTWYPLLSQISFEIWQREVYSYLIMKFLPFEGEATIYTKEILILLGGLRDPESITQILPRVARWLATSNVELVEHAIAALWAHPIYGDGRPMHHNVKTELKVHIDRLLEISKLMVDDPSQFPNPKRVIEQIASEK